MGLTGLEPVTLRLSSACSNQLSYRPGNPVAQRRAEQEKTINMGLSARNAKCGRAEDPQVCALFEARMPVAIDEVSMMPENPTTPCSL